MTKRLWVALDVPQRDQAEAILERLGSHRHIKVGMELYYRLGPDFVRQLVDRGYHIFLDLKCHDIPRTVGRAVAAVQSLGAEVLTVHAQGGLEMLEAARQEAGTMSVVAVTMLTSLDQALLQDLGISVPLPELVERAADLARRAGLAGVVAASPEIGRIHHRWPGARIIVPGIRFPGQDTGDQRRVAGPAEAVAAGATDLVVGRPIVAASDPAEALSRFVAAMSQ
ncbi:orotidine-5'-phosphate decarboxylase [Sulfobacillus harzensis]|uniref:Orotidine 5'-phosphate decarboxylase n=1 Tax=Sulfobacillus harzensis TaxID=2729629 RepID=A0A7Y0Q122_9FIRM|nr:orotidine-5'-phosphate decarboxylase [Sulfobacillus harzensis]NMP21648.1 orotidine-5'-phosphate decarboxylase [Sulfobacillus harzensis]